MKNRTISCHQMLSVIFLALFPLGTEVLFSSFAAAGAAGWLCPLLAGGAAVLLVLLVGRRGLVLPREGTCRVPIGILFVWGMIFGGAQACRIGIRLSEPLGASPALLTGVFLVLAAWMAAGGLPAFARACEIFLLALGGAMVLILLGGIFRLRWDWVLLWTPEELGRVPLGTLECLGLLAVGCGGLFFLRDVIPEGRSKGATCRMIGRLSFLLAAAEILVLGRFGAPLAGRMDRSFFQMVSGLGLEGAFQRLEQMVSALWSLGDLVLMGFLLLYVMRLAGQIVGRQEKLWWAWPLAGVLFLLALPGSFWQAILDGPFLWAGNLIAGGLILAVFGFKKKK